MWRQVALAAFGLCVAWVAIGVTATGGVGSVAGSPGRIGAVSLPVGAQAAVSRALGSDRPSFWARRGPDEVMFGNAPRGLHATFGPAGTSVRGTGGAGFGISLVEIGRGGALRPMSEVAPVARRNVVSYRWPGVEEWFVNGPAGIEQGFTIARKSAVGSGMLKLALELSGGVAGHLDRDRRGLTLSAPNVTRAMRYGGLSASDRRGRSLQAAFSLRGRRLIISVDVHGAAYPLTIDPFIQAAELTASDGAASDQLGSSVAIANNTVVVGAPDHQVGSNADQGAVYVFVKQSGQPWADLTQSAELVASDGAAGDQLGTAVAIADDTVLAGAPHHEEDSRPSQGAVYVFAMPAGGWGSGPQPQVQTQEVWAYGVGSANGLLGSSLAITSEDFDSQDVLVAGAPGSQSSQGAAYLFMSGFAGSAWGYSGELTASDGAAGDRFGQSVGIGANDYSVPAVVVGAPGHGVGGAAYVYTGGGSAPTAAAELVARDAAPGDDLGTSVAISSDGNTVVAGAPNHSASQGAAYVWTAPSGGWATGTQPQDQNAELTAGDGAPGDLLGASTAVTPDGETVVVGAPGRSAFLGAADEFDGPASGSWTDESETQELAGATGGGSMRVGESVAVYGNSIVAGVPGWSASAAQSGAGAAEVFFSPEPPAVTQTPGSAVLLGTVNPENSPTTYHFEYVSYPEFATSGWETGTDVPSTDALVGSDGSFDSVYQTIAGPDPNLLYVSRLVATNQYGTTFSPPAEFSAGPQPLPLLLAGNPSQVGSTTATLTWTASSDNFQLSDYSITCTPTAGALPPVQPPTTSIPSTELPASAALFTLTTPVSGLRAGTPYRCSLALTYSGGDQAYEGIPFSGAQIYTGPEEIVTTLASQRNVSSGTSKVASSRVTVSGGSTNGSTGAIKILCASASTCAGTLTDLSRATAPRTRRTPTAGARQLVIGRARYRVKAHRRATVTFTLSPAAKRLAAREHRIPTTLIITMTGANRLRMTRTQRLVIVYHRPS